MYIYITAEPGMSLHWWKIKKIKCVPCLDMEHKSAICKIIFWLIVLSVKLLNVFYYLNECDETDEDTKLTFTVMLPLHLNFLKFMHLKYIAPLNLYCRTFVYWKCSYRKTFPPFFSHSSTIFKLNKFSKTINIIYQQLSTTQRE